MSTLMEQEARQAPEVVARAIEQNEECIKELATRIRQQSLHFANTIARGSSDHAALFAKYLFETQLKLITSSFSPSVETIYHAKPNMRNSLTVAVSQSGKSPDLVNALQAARESSSMTAALVNDNNSPLAQAAQYVIPLLAGEEKAVAATKSYISSLTNLIHLIAYVTQNKVLLRCLHELPQRLQDSLQFDWSEAISQLEQHSDILVVGRGYSFAIACEAALKLKETAAIHAESFSSAEIQHGPFALIKKDYPVFIFTQGDDTLAGAQQLAQRCAALQAKPIVVAPKKIDLPRSALRLETLPYNHPICDPVVAIQQFYVMVAHLAVRRGHNPDKPDNLSKVTKTL